MPLPTLISLRTLGVRTRLLAAAALLLAADGASYVSTDWYNSPGDGVLSEVLPRG